MKHLDQSALQSSSAPAPPPREPALVVSGVGAGYPTADGHRVVLSAIDFTLAPGERLAVVGPSGCGKSTLLHVLAGLLAPLTGEVSVAGRVVGAPGRDGSCGHSAYMFQDDLLLPWKNVLENTIFPALLSRPRGSRRHARVELERRGRQLLEEFGLGKRLASTPAELSGGMRQRVSLARTLLLGRSLILLDEPFGSLDALTRADLQQWLVGVFEDHPATWVLVTHDVTEAVLLADRIAVLGGSSPSRVIGWVTRDRQASSIDAGADWARRQRALQVQRLLEKGRER